MKHCVYCGDHFQCRDHVVPISYQSVSRSYRRGDTVPCCEQCNALAGDRVAFSIVDKAIILLGKYEHILKKMKTPIWTEESLRELDFGLQDFIRSKIHKADLVRKKIENLKLVTSYLDSIPIHETKTNNPVRKLRTIIPEKKAVVEVLLQPMPDGVALPNENLQQWWPRKRKFQKGEKHPKSKLNKEAVIWIRSNKNISLRKCAELLGVTRGAISHVRSGRCWSHVP